MERLEGRLGHARGLCQLHSQRYHQTVRPWQKTLTHRLRVKSDGCVVTRPERHRVHNDFPPATRPHSPNQQRFRQQPSARSRRRRQMQDQRLRGPGREPVCGQLICRALDRILLQRAELRAYTLHTQRRSPSGETIAHIVGHRASRGLLEDQFRQHRRLTRTQTQIDRNWSHCKPLKRLDCAGILETPRRDRRA